MSGDSVHCQLLRNPGSLVGGVSECSAQTLYQLAEESRTEEVIAPESADLGGERSEVSAAP